VRRQELREVVETARARVVEAQAYEYARTMLAC